MCPLQKSRGTLSIFGVSSTTVGIALALAMVAPPAELIVIPRFDRDGWEKSRKIFHLQQFGAPKPRGFV